MITTLLARGPIVGAYFIVWFFTWFLRHVYGF